MNGLIAHAVIFNDRGEMLIIKRSMIKRGKPNHQAGKWDIPGGGVEPRELPRDAAKREVKEEVGLDIEVGGILFEFSNYDAVKDKVFTTLIYAGTVVGGDDVVLDTDEHSEYRWVPVAAAASAGAVDYMAELCAVLDRSFRDYK